MPSDSIAGFLDHAQASRVLFPEQVEQLIRQPDIPQSNLTALCEYLLARGVLTPFQARAIREARGQELNFAGYPVLDEIGPCPGGTAYKALHPALRTPLVLRRLRTDWLAPADNGPGFVARARAIGMIPHPNVVPLLDAGFHRDELYLVIDQPAGSANLETLAREVGGAMPGFLAAEYGRAVASALRLAHERGGVHGDVRPANLLVGPLTTKLGPDGQERRRPAPDAAVRLAELGLVPLRPPVSELAPDPAALLYLPPERLDHGTGDPRGDIYGLGATLYFLLAGRPPFAGTAAADLRNQVRTAEPAPLTALRPDLPPDFVGLVGRMMDKQPDRRPATAYDIEGALAPFCRPGTVPAAQLVPVAVPMADPASGIGLPVVILVAAPAPEATDGWGVDPSTFSAAHASADAAPRKREVSAKDRGRTRMLLVIGGLLHITGIGLAVAWAMGAFNSTPAPEPDPVQKKDKDNTPPKKKTRSDRG
jgi:eukaryotic-like serine/threonine-protein kinase